MKKNTLKFFIEVALFINTCSVAALGLMLGFIIPKGRFDPDRNFLGLHRHDWGDIHLYLAFFLIVLLALHLSLNWSWILQAAKRFFGEKWRAFLWIVSGSWFFVLFAAWIIMVL